MNNDELRIEQDYSESELRSGQKLTLRPCRLRQRHSTCLPYHVCEVIRSGLQRVQEHEREGKLVC